jgi:hypothetical protein
MPGAFFCLKVYQIELVLENREGYHSNDFVLGEPLKYAFRFVS